jgi:hypothetical protein
MWPVTRTISVVIQHNKTDKSDVQQHPICSKISPFMFNVITLLFDLSVLSLDNEWQWSICRETFTVSWMIYGVLVLTKRSLPRITSRVMFRLVVCFPRNWCSCAISEAPLGRCGQKWGLKTTVTSRRKSGHNFPFTRASDLAFFLTQLPLTLPI